MIGKLGQSTQRIFEWNIDLIETDNILIKTTSARLQKNFFTNYEWLEFEMIAVNKTNENICFYVRRLYVSKGESPELNKFSPENGIYPKKFDGNKSFGRGYEGKTVIPPNGTKRILAATPAVNLDDSQSISLKLVILENPIAVACANSKQASPKLK